jgi:hypothetical protein
LLQERLRIQNVRLLLPQCLILPITLLELGTNDLIIRNHRPLPHTDREDQVLALKKRKHFDASLGSKNNEIDMAGASQHLAFSSSAPQGAGHGSSEQLIDSLNIECPYHTHILREPMSYGTRETSANTTQRFMIHHPGEQYALFNRPDNEMISIYRGCICSFMIGDNFSFTEMENMARAETNLSGFQVGL